MKLSILIYSDKDLNILTPTLARFLCIMVRYKVLYDMAEWSEWYQFSSLTENVDLATQLMKFNFLIFSQNMLMFCLLHFG